MSLTVSRLEVEEHKLDNIKRDIREKQAQCSRRADDAKREIQSLKSQSKDATLRYGRHMPAMLRMVTQRKDEFHALPVHIGLNTKVKDMEYSLVVFAALTHTMLNRWLVTDQHDMMLLRDIAKRANWNEVNASVTRFLGHRHDTRRNRPDTTRYTTVENLVEVANDEVYNALVDSAQIERVCVFKTDDECVRYTWTGPRGNPKPFPNVAKTLSMDSLTTYRVIGDYRKGRGSQDTMPINEGQKRSFETRNPFQKDSSAALEKLQRVLQEEVQKNNQSVQW